MLRRGLSRLTAHHSPIKVCCPIGQHSSTLSNFISCSAFVSSFVPTQGTIAFNKSWLSKLHQQAWQDLKTRWRRSLFWVGCFFAFLGLCFSLAIIDTPSTTSSSLEEHTATACQPDGSFSLDLYDYKPWDASGFVQITLGFGTLTFTQAKVIDVVWDMVSLRVQEKRTRFGIKTWLWNEQWWLALLTVKTTVLFLCLLFTPTLVFAIFEPYGSFLLCTSARAERYEVSCCSG
jgi:hypothetical protein